MLTTNTNYTTSFYTLTWEQVEGIWEQRAQEIARVAAPVESGEQKAVLLARLGGELFGLGMDFVSDIRPRAALTHAMNMPDWVMGVINQRGRALPVIDLRHYLGLPPAALPGPLAFVTVRTQNREVIFCVDDVDGAEALPVCRDLNSAGIHLPAKCAAVVERRAEPGEQPYVAVLDIQALLADPRLIIQ